MLPLSTQLSFDDKILPQPPPDDPFSAQESTISLPRDRLYLLIHYSTKKQLSEAVGSSIYVTSSDRLGIHPSSRNAELTLVNAGYRVTLLA